MDLVKGINTRNAAKQVGSWFGLAPKQDYDILDNYSVRGGDRSPVNGAYFGPQNNNPNYNAPQTQQQPTNNNQDTFNLNDYAGDTSSGSGSGGSSADTQAYYQDQIDTINKLLGNYSTQLDSGLSSLNNKFNTQKTDLSNERTRAMNEYAAKSVENAKDKETGLNDVDNFVNTSYNSLIRLLSGAGAGNSSTARTVVPTLVSKAGSTRRTGVIDTAGKNEANIVSARDDAENQFTNSERDLDEWKKGEEKTLRTNIGNAKTDLLSKLQALEYERSQANGGGYANAKANSASTQERINEAMSELDSLFRSYNPTYTPKEINLKTPDINKYTIDKGNIETNSNLPVETRYFLPQLKKRQELSY